MSVYIQNGDNVKSRICVYVFPDNDNEAFVTYYWAHAIKKDMKVVLTHTVKEGNGWYLRKLAELY